MSTFPGYRVVAKSATGTLCEVYRAERVADGHAVSVTALRPELHNDALIVSAFRQQARLAQQLQHPNIAHALSEDDAACDQADRLWYAHELVAGPPLAERLAAGDAARSQPTNEEICRIALQLCAALHCAHTHEPTILHGGLTPRTVFIPDDADVRLVGFGVPVSAEDGAAAPPALGCTAYLSPEQVHAGTIEPRSDLYSLGATLYALATGRAPTDAGTEAPESAQPLYPQAAPRTLRPDLHPELDQLILRLLAVDPQERPRDVAAVRRDIERIAADLEHGGAALAGTRGGSAASVAAAPASRVAARSAGRDKRVRRKAQRSPLRRWTQRVVTTLVLLVLLALSLVVQSYRFPQIAEYLPPEVVAVRDWAVNELTPLTPVPTPSLEPIPSQLELLADALQKNGDEATAKLDQVAAFTEYFRTWPTTNVRRRLAQSLGDVGVPSDDDVFAAAGQPTSSQPVVDSPVDQLIVATSRALLNQAIEQDNLAGAGRYFAAFYALHASQLRILDAAQRDRYLENWVWPLEEEVIDHAPPKVLQSWTRGGRLPGPEFFCSALVRVDRNGPDYLVPALYISEQNHGQRAVDESGSDPAGSDNGLSFDEARKLVERIGTDLPTLLDCLALAERRTGNTDSTEREWFQPGKQVQPATESGAAARPGDPQRVTKSLSTKRTGAGLYYFPDPQSDGATALCEWAEVDPVLLGEADANGPVPFRVGAAEQKKWLASGNLTSDDGGSAFYMRFRYCLRLADVIRLDFPATNPPVPSLSPTNQPND